MENAIQSSNWMLNEVSLQAAVPFYLNMCEDLFGMNDTFGFPAFVIIKGEDSSGNYGQFPQSCLSHFFIILRPALCLLFQDNEDDKLLLRLQKTLLLTLARNRKIFYGSKLRRIISFYTSRFA